MSKGWLDLETFSETPINDGAHRYAEKSEVLLWPFALDDSPVECWDLTSGVRMPNMLEDIISDERIELWWQNGGMFDRTVLEWTAPKTLARMHESRWRDTMVQALCHGLPGSLSALCEIFRLDSDVAKDKRGKQLIRMFCMPQPKNSKIRRRTKETNPAEWLEFIEYAKSDIRSMRVLHQKMPKWNYPNNEFELKLWQLDQRINNEGVYVDLELSAKAIEATDLAQAQLANDVSEATNGEVAAATQRDKLLEHILREHGVSLPDMRSDTLQRRMDDPFLPDGVRDLIAIRLMASTSSVSKYKRVIRSTSSDGYLRGLIQFSGAGRTGRDAGRLFQPQNLMRPTLKGEVIEEGIEAIKAGCADLITDNVMELCANAMRGVIIAPPGKKLVIADLSNIEGRVLAWLAGEEWKLQAFRDYDKGIGPDLYIASYARTFRVPLEQAKRQVGKVLELAMGFGGGVGSFITFAAVYGLDLEKMTSGLDLPADVVAEAENFWNWSIDTKRSTYGLSKEVFIACDSLKRLWRRAHPKVVSMWAESENAFREAVYDEKAAQALHEERMRQFEVEGGSYYPSRVKDPKPQGTVFKTGKCDVVKNGNWLKVRLPSGRYLSYPSPQAGDKLSFMGINQYSRKWSRISTYGGKLVENMTQAVARDVFKSSYPAILEAGYEIKLPVHDENITYAPDGKMYGPKHLSQLMATVPPWASGLPLAAAGFEAYRYKKEG